MTKKGRHIFGGK